MMRSICVLLLSISIAAGANAASLSVYSDKPAYHVGETITLTVFGDDAGVTVYGIYGRLLYNGALVDNVAATQIALQGDSYGRWTRGFLWQQDDGILASSDAFNQIAGLEAQSAINLPDTFATVTLIARAVGLVTVAWDTTPDSGFQLMFFGLTDAPGTSFVIFNPEPATGALLSLGLLVLASTRRRR